MKNVNNPAMYAGGVVPELPWKHWEHAIRLHALLKKIAVMKGTITYKEAAAAISTKGNPLYFRILDGRVFNLVEMLCLRDDEPPLWVLVVNKQTGLPGYDETSDGSWRPRGGNSHMEMSIAQRECWKWGALQ